MATDPIPVIVTPLQPISPEDDATLQAIEALEARSIDPDPEPYIPRVAPRPVVTAKAVIIEPRTVKMVAPTPAPAPKTMEPIITRTAVADAHNVVKHTTPTPTPAPKPSPQLLPKPKVHKTPAVEIAEELANAPPTIPGDAPFQPFSKQKPSKKSLLIIVGVIMVLGLIIGGYFVWQSLHGS